MGNFRGYLAAVRSEEHNCECGHIRRRHALVYGARRMRYGGACLACPCARFKLDRPINRAAQSRAMSQ